MAISMGNTSLMRYGFVGKYILGPTEGQLTNDPVSYSRYVFTWCIRWCFGNSFGCTILYMS